MNAIDSVRLVKAAWRCARRADKEHVYGVDKSMTATRHIAATFFLAPDQHRRACEQALSYGEPTLAARLTELELGRS